MEKIVFTRREVAQTLGVAVATVDKLIREGELPSFRPSPRRVIIPAAAFKAWLDAQAKQGA